MEIRPSEKCPSCGQSASLTRRTVSTSIHVLEVNCTNTDCSNYRKAAA